MEQCTNVETLSAARDGALRVVLVDDDPMLLALHCMALRPWGARVETRTAGDGEEGAALIASYQPHLVLTDFDMPKRNGLEMIRRIEQDGASAATRFMLVTARERHELPAAEDIRTPYEVLNKADDIASLRRRLSAHLGTPPAN